MDLVLCTNDHWIKFINGGLVTKELSVTHWRPTRSINQWRDIQHASVSKAKNNRDDDFDDNDLENITLQQLYVMCKTRKRKYLPSIDSSKTNNQEKQISLEDSDFLETLSTLKSKLWTKMKKKKRKCIEDSLYTSNTQENIPFVKSKETHISQEFANSCGDLPALVEEIEEVPETDSLDHPMMLSNVNDSSSACDGPDNYSGVVATEEADIANECYVENNNNNNQALVPIDEECSLENELSREDHDDFIPLQMALAPCKDIVVSNPELSNEPDGDTSISLPNVATPEFTTDVEVHAKTSSTTEHDFNHGGSLVPSSDNSPESNENLSSSSTNELITSNEHCTSDLDLPNLLLSNWQTMSPSSKERLRKAIELIDIADKDLSKCKEKLHIGEKTGTPLGLSAEKTIENSEKHMKYIQQVSAILKKELKSVTGILDDTIRSEFCVSTSLRYKVDKATLAIKKATDAEEDADRSIAMLLNKYNRFLTLMKTVKDKVPEAEIVTPKTRSKLMFTDEVGGTLCQVRFFKSDQTLSESITEKESSSNNLPSIAEKGSSCSNLPSIAEKKNLLQ